MGSSRTVVARLCRQLVAKNGVPRVRARIDIYTDALDFQKYKAGREFVWMILRAEADAAQNARPGLTDQAAVRELQAALAAGIDAFNFGNTRRIEEPRLSQRAGGLSGPELFPGVLETVRDLRRTVGPRLGIIATGGVDTPAKALAALEAGADAVGCFTAFITRGPTFPRRVALALLEILARRGLRRLADLRSPA